MAWNAPQNIIAAKLYNEVYNEIIDDFSWNSSYRGASGRVNMHYALDVWPGSVDGRVEGESSLIYAQISAAAVYDLTLQVDLHLRTHSMLLNTRYTNHSPNATPNLTLTTIFLQVL